MQESQPTRKKFKSTYILAIIFLVLVAIFWLMKSGDKDQEEPKLFFKDLNIDAINRFEITRARLQYSALEKRDGIWIVTSQGEATAEPSYVQSILDAVKDMKVSGAVSENPEKQKTFQVDDLGIEAKFYQGGELLAHFYIGRFGPDNNSNYIRREGSDKVYLTQGMIRFPFERPDFRDLTMLYFSPDTVKKVTIKYKNGDGEDIEIERRGAEWLVNNGGAGAEKVEEFLDDLRNLKAMDVIQLEQGEEEETGFDEPPMAITLEFNDGTEKTLTIGNGYKRVATYYAKVSDDATIYMMTQGQHDLLKKGAEDFK